MRMRKSHASENDARQGTFDGYVVEPQDEAGKLRWSSLDIHEAVNADLASIRILKEDIHPESPLVWIKIGSEGASAQLIWPEDEKADLADCIVKVKVRCTWAAVSIEGKDDCKAWSIALASTYPGRKTPVSLGIIASRPEAARSVSTCAIFVGFQVDSSSSHFRAWRLQRSLLQRASWKK